METYDPWGLFWCMQKQRRIAAFFLLPQIHQASPGLRPVSMVIRTNNSIATTGKNTCLSGEVRGDANAERAKGGQTRSEVGAGTDTGSVVWTKIVKYGICRETRRGLLLPGCAR